MSSAATDQTLLARQVAAALVASGVCRVVASPGSRSTPLLLACAERDELELVAVADERSAAFFALGAARASAQPVALLCTSGSAPGHYLPAVMEASAAEVPLLVLSSNRPPERDAAQAPQTTDQRRLYGVHARGCFEIGPAAPGRRALAAAGRIVALAVDLARGPLPGPVQVDVRLRKPLEPAPLPAAGDVPAAGAGSSPTPVPRFRRPTPRVDEDTLTAVAEAVAGARRPLLVAGPGPLARGGIRDAVAALVELGVPAACELTSQLRGTGDLSMLPLCMQVPAFRRALRPDLVLQLGAAPVSGGWEPWIESLAAAGCPHWVLTEGAAADPVSTATEVARGEFGDLLPRLVEALAAATRMGGAVGSSAWRRSLEEADAIARACVEEAASASGTEGSVARAVTGSLPPGALLAVGNSLAVRLAETWVPADLGGAIRGVWHQRGLNGIDGIVSGVAGSLEALGGSGHVPARLLIGDVSLQHDLGGLALLRRPACRRLDVVLVDNGGGRIFDRLPVADLDLDDATRALFSTPPSLDWSAAAAAFGLEFAEAGDGEGLRELLAQPADGPRILRAVVEPGREALDHRRLLERLGARLDSAMRDVAADDGPERP